MNAYAISTLCQLASPHLPALREGASLRSVMKDWQDAVTQALKAGGGDPTNHLDRLSLLEACRICGWHMTEEDALFLSAFTMVWLAGELEWQDKSQACVAYPSAGYWHGASNKWAVSVAQAIGLR